jgi:translation elongation factor EF-G
MKEIAISVEDKVDELLAALDKDIQHIQQSLSRLDELRSLVIKRDDAALSKLLERIRDESDSYRSHELKRQSIRQEIAIAIGCNPEKMTLSALEARLSNVKREEAARKKTRLTSLIKKLKREHLSTTLFLSECARINRMLLNDVFKLGNAGTVYYGCKGATKRQSDMAFFNLQF